MALAQLSSLLIHIRLDPIVIGCLFRVTKKLRVIIDDITLLVLSKECLMSGGGGGRDEVWDRETMFSQLAKRSPSVVVSG